MTRKFVNLTPHPITIFKGDGSVVEIPPSGKVLRLREEDEAMGELDGIPLVRRRFFVPDMSEVFKDEDSVYIVSLAALMGIPAHIKERYMVVAPDTGSGAVRDEQGRIIGTRNFITA